MMKTAVIVMMTDNGTPADDTDGVEQNSDKDYLNDNKSYYDGDDDGDESDFASVRAGSKDDDNSRVGIWMKAGD